MSVEILKPGDVVLISKPEDTNEYPEWKQWMNYLDNKVVTITKANETPYLTLNSGNNLYSYPNRKHVGNVSEEVCLSFNWLELLESTQKENKMSKTKEELTGLLSTLQNHAVEAGKTAAAATVSDRLVAVINKKTGNKFNILKKVPYLGDIRGLVAPVLVLAVATLVPSSKYTTTARAVALRAYDGKAYEKARELMEDGVDLLASVAKIDIASLD